MRIAVWHDLPSGGALRALAGQVRMLHAAGHELVAYTPNSLGPDFAGSWWPAHVPVEILPFSEAAPRKGYLDQRFESSLDEFRWRQRMLELHTRAVAKACEMWKADILLAHPCWWFFASPIARYFDGPTVLYLQEPFRPLYEASPENTWAAPAPAVGRRLRARVGAWIRDHRRVLTNREHVREEISWVRAFDRILVNSLYSRESILRAYGVDAIYCPLGIDHAGFGVPPAVPKEHVVVSLGQMSPHKNALLAVAAIASIPSSVRPPLRWFGNRPDPWYLDEVARAAAASGVEFSYHQEVPDELLAVELARAACFIYCAKLEPLGLAPLEANLAGTSVVAVAEGGVRETIVEGINGSLVGNRDAAALGRAILPYTNDLAHAARAGARARDHVLSRYSWARAGAEIERQLQEVLAASRAHGHPGGDRDVPVQVTTFADRVLPDETAARIAAHAVSPAARQL